MTTAYVKELIVSHPTIAEVWLIGSRAEGSARPTSDWDYLVIADQRTLESLSAKPEFNDPKVDLVVVYDGDNFRKPWLDGDRDKYGSLSGWDWNQTSESEAHYRATKARSDDDFYSWVSQGRAVRVYARSTDRE
jgi:predicted nucleotidyltransferase